MHARTVGTLAAIVAALTLAFGVQAASARTFNWSNQQFRITWRELKFFDQGFAEFVALCPVTMEGSFHSRTIAKVVESLIGYITRAAVSEALCRDPAGGAAEARFLPETLPWHIRYAGFQGTLPNITRIRVRILRVAYEDVIRGTPCLFSGLTTPINAEFFREAFGVITAFEFEAATTLPAAAGNCVGLAIRGGLERISTTFTLLNSTTRITVTLI
ncbi:MAG TPA: hypothetical protein VF250_04090 [Conexibacter sp.]